MKKNIIVAMVMATFFQACVVQSINRYYTDDLLIELKALDGKWRLLKDYQGDVSDDKIPPWIFAGEDLTVFDSNNRKSRLEMAVFKIGDTILLDFMAEPPENECGYWVFAIAPKHILFKLELNAEKSRMTLLPLNYEWFESRIKTNDPALKYAKAKEDYDVPAFTFSSAEWVQYLKTHLNEEGFFDGDSSMTLERVPGK